MHNVCGGGGIPQFHNSYIDIQAENNMIYCEKGVRLLNCKITFVGQGNLVYLCSNCYDYCLNVRIYNNSVFFIDENNYMNGLLNVLVQEHQNIVIGKGGAFSYGINIMTADGHLIYDIQSGDRLNDSKSVFIGDHVWIGQFATILKGTIIGSGSVVGSNSLVTGKEIASNTIYGGIPANEIKRNIFWKSDCPNLFDEKKTEQYKNCNLENYIYKCHNSIDIYEIDFLLKNNVCDISEKIRFIEKLKRNKEYGRLAR
ncbi:polysialic acid O-acetyltransferase [Lachnospiraceae bacterium]|nr:polysialic acid O-acetyltransferase [Lachnospiraceae bacterium]